MPDREKRLSFNRLYEPYDLNAAHKNKLLQTHQPEEQIIREYDWNNLPEWFTQIWQVDFFPITREYIRAKQLWYSLQGKEKIAKQYSLIDYPERLIKQLSDPPFWFSIYKEWFIKYNGDDELVARIALDNPDSRLGIGVFNKRQKDNGKLQ